MLIQSLAGFQNLLGLKEVIIKNYILFLITNLLVLNSCAQAVIDSTNIDSLLLARKEAYYPKTFTLEDSVFEVESVLIKNILFYDGRLHAEGKEQLTDFIFFLKEFKEMKIEIIVHTDVRGKEFFNYKSSESRAESVYDLIESKGIDINRLKYAGKGESELIITEEEILALSTKELQEKAHALNRRTEFRINKIK